MTEDEKYGEIEVMHLRSGVWQHYVSHPTWSLERLQKSVDRHNKEAPKSRIFRVKPTSDDPRLQQVRDVEEEIAWVQEEVQITEIAINSEPHVSRSRRLAMKKRVLTREAAALADLKRGLRVAE